MEEKRLKKLTFAIKSTSHASVSIGSRSSRRDHRMAITSEELRALGGGEQGYRKI
jgi:hypothetical protein